MSIYTKPNQTQIINISIIKYIYTLDIIFN